MPRSERKRSFGGNATAGDWTTAHPHTSICWIIARLPGLDLVQLARHLLTHPLLLQLFVPSSLFRQLTTPPLLRTFLRLALVRNRPAKMLGRGGRGAVNGLSKARGFSSTTPASAVSPYRRAAQAASARTTNKPTKRPSSTTVVATATQDRPVPSPAFNRDDTRWRDVQPLRPYRPQEMDHTFVGMTGGEIFHEMMLRQGIKHICMHSIAFQSLRLIR